ncbi:MAG: hypothetical protein ACQEW0_17895 [Pseudomonadota bacterium]
MSNDFKLPAFFYYLLVFLFLFMPYVNVLGVVLHLPYYYFFLFTCLFILVFSFRRISKEYFYTFMLFSVSYFWVLGISAWTGKFDLNMQINYLNAFLVIFGAYGLSIFIAKRYKAESGIFLIKAIYFSGVAHAVIMIITFFVSPVREALYSFVILGTKGQDFVDNMYRAPGLTTGGGDALSVLQAICLVLGLYYLISIRNKVSLLFVFGHLAFFSLLFVSILLSARTGLVVLFLGLFMLASRHYILLQRSGNLSRSTLKKLVFISIFFSFSIPILYFGLISSNYSRFAQRAFELYINLVEHGEIGTSSTDHLKTMYFMPSSSIQFLFGDGNFGRDVNLPVIPSDIGYVRVLFGGGIFGVILFYMPLVLLSMNFAKKAKVVGLYFPLVFIVSTLFLVNLKVYHLYGQDLGFKVLLLFVAILIAKQSRAQSNAIS